MCAARQEEETCAGYERDPHPTTDIVAEREYPGGHRDKLCRTCYTRWQLSDENWPPEDTTIKPKKLA